MFFLAMLLPLGSAPDKVVLSINADHFDEFVENNPHIEAEKIDGVVGSQTTEWPETFASPEVVETSPSHDLGSSYSHFSIWQRVVDSNSTTLVLEDDAVVSPWIHTFEQNNIDRINRADITLCYANMNSILTTQDESAVVKSSLMHPSQPSLSFASFALSRTKASVFHKLVHGFGTSCYWITPHGARLLLEKVFPLTTGSTRLPFLPHAVVHTSIDRKLQDIYQDVDAQITLPFMAYATRHTER